LACGKRAISGRRSKGVSPLRARVAGIVDKK
jgi:hypothetical protein